MVTGADRVVRLAWFVYKVMDKLYRIYDALTPQEQEAVKNHLQAIYGVFRKVANRRKEATRPLPMLMLPPLEMKNAAPGVRKRGRIRIQERSRQFRYSARRTARIVREYQSSFTTGDAKEIGEHLNDIRKISLDAERRSRK